MSISLKSQTITIFLSIYTIEMEKQILRKTFSLSDLFHFLPLLQQCYHLKFQPENHIQQNEQVQSTTHRQTADVTGFILCTPLLK